MVEVRPRNVALRVGEDVVQSSCSSLHFLSGPSLRAVGHVMETKHSVEIDGPGGLILADFDMELTIAMRGLLMEKCAAIKLNICQQFLQKVQGRKSTRKTDKMGNMWSPMNKVWREARAKKVPDTIASLGMQDDYTCNYSGPRSV